VDAPICAEGRGWLGVSVDEKIIVERDTGVNSKQGQDKFVEFARPSSVYLCTGGTELEKSVER
jgi:hypothetical protein